MTDRRQVNAEFFTVECGCNKHGIVEVRTSASNRRMARKRRQGERRGRPIVTALGEETATFMGDRSGSDRRKDSNG